MIKDQSGVIMLEGLIVMLATVILLFFMLAIFSTIFQRFNIQVIAKETAAKIAQNYQYNRVVEIASGEMTVDGYTSINPYRYLFGQAPFLIGDAFVKADRYAPGRLERSTFTIATNTEVNVAVHKASLGRQYVEVTIDGGYKVPFGGAMDYFGFGNVLNYSVKGYADCVDLSNYINVVNFTEKWTKFSEESIFLKTATSVMKMFGNLKKIFFSNNQAPDNSGGGFRNDDS